MVTKNKLSLIIFLIFGVICSSVFSSSEDSLSDPTQPFFNVVVSNKVIADPLTLQAIYARHENMEAVINNLSVREGDKVLGVVINKIEKDRVIYTKSKKRGVLTLHKQILKRTSVEGDVL